MSAVHEPTPAPDPTDNAEASLLASARMWIHEALTAWSEDEAAKVATLAPLGVEHLGKALLWKKNPTLLVPLAQDAEKSLVELATAANLGAPKLRTVGLGALLRRLALVLDGLPIADRRTKRMTDVRNGAIHVGSTVESRNVLLDALALCNAFLDALCVDKDDFFGEHSASVQRLLEEKRTEVGHRVAANLARARHRLRELEQHLPAETFQALTWDLEARAPTELPAEDYGYDLHGMNLECPECGSAGRLFGEVDLEPDVDVDVEPLGNGEYAFSEYQAAWEITFRPRAFACNVCRLELTGPDELAECQLPTSSYRVEAEVLGPDFDPDELFAHRYHGDS